MVVVWIIAVVGALVVGVLIDRSLSKSSRFSELVMLAKENCRLKEELAKKTEQAQHWEATPETTTTENAGR